MTKPPIPARFRDPYGPYRWGQPRWLQPTVTRDDAVTERLRLAHLEGDPLADALVEWMYEVGLPVGRRAFEQALTHGLASVEAPSPALRAFFSAVESVPAWLDRAQLERACRCADRTLLISGEYVLFSLGLLAGYASSGVTKTLVRTGSLQKMAPRRYAETSKFVDDVYLSRTLDRFSSGWQSTVKVRLMHALVRHQLHRKGWDVERWGVAINQADMLATVLQFSAVYMTGLRLLGHIIPARDREAMTHLWRYVGLLLGVSPDLLPATASEGRTLVRLIGASQEGPDEDGRALAEALLAVPGNRHGDWLPGWLQRIDTAFRAGFARLALGTAAADAMGLPHRSWKYAPLALAPFVYTLELARCAIPGATAWNERLGERARRARVARWLHGEAPTYMPHSVT